MTVLSASSSSGAPSLSLSSLSSLGLGGAEVERTVAGLKVAWRSWSHGGTRDPRSPETDFCLSATHRKWISRYLLTPGHSEPEKVAWLALRTQLRLAPHLLSSTALVARCRHEEEAPAPGHTEPDSRP